MYKLIRRLTNFPPHPLVHNASNPWETVAPYETLTEAKVAYDACPPSSRYEYAVTDASGNRMAVE